MADVIETARDIGIEHIFILVLDATLYCLNCIMTGTSWTKTIAIAFKLCFPFWFKSLFCKGLTGPVDHDGNSKRALFLFSWFGYPDPSERLWSSLGNLLWVKCFNHFQSSCRWYGFDSIDTSSFLALV